MAEDFNLENLDEDLKKLMLVSRKPVVLAEPSNSAAMSVGQIEEASSRPQQVYLGISKPEDLARAAVPDIGGDIVRQAFEAIKKYKPENQEKEPAKLEKIAEKKPEQKVKQKNQASILTFKPKLKKQEPEKVSPYDTLKQEIEALREQIIPTVSLPSKDKDEEKKAESEVNKFDDFKKVIDELYGNRQPQGIKDEELLAMGIIGLGLPLVGGLLGQASGDYALMKTAGLVGPTSAESLYKIAQERDRQAIDSAKQKADLLAKFKLAELTKGPTTEALEAKMDALALNLEGKLAQAAAENLLKQAELKRKAVEGESGYGLKSKGLEIEQQRLEEMIRHNKAMEALRGRESKGPTSKSQEYVDKVYAKEYVEALSGDRLANAYRGISALRESLNQLRNKPSLVGGALTYGPRFVREAFDKESIDLQERIEYIIQNQLRPVLGAQFTEREGELLIKRSFNPRLSAEENLRRLYALTAASEWALEQKMKALKHFEQQGTMAGYKGLTEITPKSFYDKFESLLSGKKGSSAVGVQKGGILSEEQRKKMIEEIKSKRGY